MEATSELRREMSENKLTEIEHWKMLSIANELNALSSESKYIDSEIKRFTMMRKAADRNISSIQEKKESAIALILKRVGIANEDVEFELALTNDPKCSIIRHN